MELTITLGKITRTFHVDADDIYHNDWNETIRDMLNTVEEVEPQREIAGVDFDLALNGLDNLKI